MCNFMEIMLTKEGYQVETTQSPVEGLSRLDARAYDLAIVDLQMPEMTGIEFVREARTRKQDQEIFLMTAYASVDTAIEAMKQGASDYITKPFKVDEIKLAIEKAIKRQHLIRENQDLRQQLSGVNSFDAILGNSEAIVRIKKLARRVANSDSTVLIRGESGTGKDLMARALHHESNRRTGPFVTINCAALPETLLESELFGHKKGSFTGAVKDKEGLLTTANEGTFFLDEVGNMPLSIQVKLLRVLEDKKVMPVGDTVVHEVDIRLIAATNADLEIDVRAGRFRADLFYRLNVISLLLPSLRERREDIPVLVEHFLQRYSVKNKQNVRGITDEAMKKLVSYTWPGNVRELENMLERAMLLNRSGKLEIADFPEKLLEQESSAVVSEAVPSTPTLESIEKAYIHYIMSQTDGRKTEAARLLGIDASTLYRKIERYKLQERPGKKKRPEGDEEPEGGE